MKSVRGKVISKLTRTIRIDDEFEKLLVRRASEMNMNVSEYVRHAVLFESLFDGDVESMAVIGKRIKKMLMDAVGGLVSA